MRVFTEGSYQGISLNGWSLCRKPGLSHDTGWVEMDRNTLKIIKIEPQFRPWVTVKKDGKAEVQEPPGPMHLGAALRILGAGRTVTAPEATQNAGVLSRGGPIRIVSVPHGGPLGGNDPVVLHPMFIAPSGIREIEEDLASAVLHEESPIRIAVVDIRYWWDKYGTPVWGNYNITNEYGRFDEQYLIDKKPSTLGDLIKYLCLCLPGSPVVDSKSDCFAADIVPPQNIKMRFELPSVWLDRLLSAYGMELHLTRLSSVFIAKRGGPHAPQFFSSDPGGNTSQPSSPPESQKRTVYSVDVPEGVFVSGGQRERRIIANCELCFTDEFGRIRRLADLPRLWNGYTVEQAMAQVVQSHEKAGSDIPHKDGRQWVLRKQIMHRDFFRMYAPYWMFEIPDAADVPAYDKGLAQFWDQKSKKHPFMPMRSPIFTREEISKIADVKLVIGSAVNGDESLTEFHPLVRAATIRKDHSDDLKAFQATTDAALRDLEGKRDAIRSNLEAMKTELTELTEGRPLWSVFAGTSRGSAIVRALHKYGLIDITTIAAAKEFASDILQGSVAKLEKQVQEDKNWNAAVARATTQLSGAEDGWKKEVVDLTRKILKLKENFTSAFKSVERDGIARMWVNTPWGLVQDAHVDKETGVVRFNELAAIMDYPAVRDLENAKITGGGAVEVTYMYRTDRNRPSDYGYWSFMAPTTPTDKPTLVEIVSPTGLKGIPVSDDSLVVYEREDGEPLNLGDVTEKARRIAGFILDTARQNDGYEYKYLGVLKVCTDATQNEVQWTFDGDKAETVILVNNPDGSENGWQSLSQKRLKEKVLYPERTKVYKNA